MLGNADPVAEIARLLAIEVNGPNGTDGPIALQDFTATVTGSKIDIERDVAGDAPVVNVTRSRHLVDSTVPSLVGDRATEIEGESKIGDSWNLTIGGVSISVTVDQALLDAADTNAAIAQSLAQIILDDDSLSEFGATAEGDRVIVSNLNGSPFSLLATRTQEFDVSPGNAQFVTLSEDPVAGEAFTVRLVGNGAFSSHSFVATEDTLSAEAVVSSLASVINEGAPAVYTAMGEGELLIIANRSGNFFTLSEDFVIDTETAHATTVVLAGSPVVGDVWRLAMKFGNESIEIVDYTVAVGDTVETIAEKLAERIGITAPDHFDAIVDATGKIFIIKRTSGEFDTTFTRIPVEFGQVATTAQISLEGTPILSDKWRVIVDGESRKRHQREAGDRPG